MKGDRRHVTSPRQDDGSAARRAPRIPTLPEDLLRLLADTQGATNRALAEKIDLMCGDAFHVGFERGYHAGWDAAEADADAEAARNAAAKEEGGT